MGISDANVVGSLNGRVAGESLTPSAFMFLPGSSLPTWIGNGWGLGGGAFGISPDGSRIVGWGLLDRGAWGTFRRPLIWRDTGTSGVYLAPFDLAANLVEVVPMRAGEARAVNTLGRVVGQMTMFSDGVFIPRGFLSRTEPTGASAPLEEPTDVLLPSNGDLFTSTAGMGISSPIAVSGSGKGYVVGHHLTPNFLSAATFWFPRSETPPTVGALSPGVLLGTWEDPISEALDPQSAALGVNSSQMIVG